MDTSKEYIEMCRKAYEVQELKKHHYLGDFVFYNRFDTVCTVVDIDINEGCNLPKVVFVEDGIVGGDWVNDHELRDLIWLPRQDQLQEIVDDLLYTKIARFEHFLNDIDRQNVGCFSSIFVSFEQLWLCFVMREEYKKLWNLETKEWYDSNWDCKFCKNLNLHLKPHPCKTCKDGSNYIRTN